ncbi:hypothetical protein BDV96DRAFT_651228 [Lophiotrema nucula]|uniref:Uncharacterized protein n=1 Tax=Lophiotrema nucula TaxID=690887 RepID=A0A6A5YSE3_9PLEO|nr:hypothetical protein BDV96DRAFT_651228 [Lophiotrema nucula]
MAPSFRARDRSNRSGRGPVEHNVLEGLPINQYKEVEITVGLNQQDNKQADKDAWPELPLPRDFHNLPEHSQQLLRAARAGRTVKPPAPQEEDRENLSDDEQQKEVHRGITIKKYVKVARHLEEPEPEYLAKRRKGLPSQYAPINALASIQQTPMRETKVKKVDSEGNVTVLKALVPEGQVVENEVQATDAAAEAAPVAAAPGTVVEGVGVVNAEGVVVAAELMQQTPPRRKPPPPKKKKRGPGRGHKKVVFVEGQTEQGTPASGSDLLAVPGANQEGGSAEPSVDGDTPMADAGDDDGEDGEEEEGSDHDDHEQMEQSQTPAEVLTPIKSAPELTALPASEPTSEPVQPPDQQPAAPLIDAPIPDAPAPTEPPAAPKLPAVEPSQPIESQVELEKAANGHDPSSSPDLPLAVAHSRQNSLTQIPSGPLLQLDSSVQEILSTDTIPTESITVEAPVAEPMSIEAAVPKPITIEHPVVEPIPIEPPVPEPIMIEPPVVEPIPIEPPVAEPIPIEPPVVEPIPIEPPVAEPILIEPPVVEPIPMESPVAEPIPIESPVVEPDSIEPPAPVSIPVEPITITPDSVATESLLTAAPPVETAPVEPAPADPVPPAATAADEAPPPEIEPDLMDDLERHLEKDSETAAGS